MRPNVLGGDRMEQNEIDSFFSEFLSRFVSKQLASHRIFLRGRETWFGQPWTKVYPRVVNGPTSSGSNPAPTRKYKPDPEN